jgi:hypothetical protein
VFVNSNADPGKSQYIEGKKIKKTRRHRVESDFNGREVNVVVSDAKSTQKYMSHAPLLIGEDEVDDNEVNGEETTMTRWTVRWGDDDDKVNGEETTMTRWTVRRRRRQWGCWQGGGGGRGERADPGKS